MIEWKSYNNIFCTVDGYIVYFDVTKFNGYLLKGYGLLTRTEYLWYLEHGTMEGYSK